MELLFDDQWIDRKAGVRRILGPVRKEAEPVLKPEKAWDRARVHGCQALFYDEEEGCFKLWYRGQTPEEEVAGDDDPTAAPSERRLRDFRTFLCYATSDDGIAWRRPDLGRHSYGGEDATNIVSGLTGGDSIWWNILKDPDDPDPARRYKALGFESQAPTSRIRGVEPGRKGLFVGYSPDGFDWPGERLHIMDTNEVTDADCMLPQREPTTGRWVGFFRPRTEPKRRFIGYSESDDFEHWTFPRMLLTPDRGDTEWIEFYGLSVMCFGRWRVGSLWIYHNNPEFSPMTNELVYSRDGLTYHRAMPGESFVPLGGAGEWDSRHAWPIGLLRVGNEAFVYYNGGNRTHGSDRTGEMQPYDTPEGEPLRTGIGLARLPMGHFCGLRAQNDGLVETKWLCNYGSAGVRLLADVPDGGALRVEVLDQHGNLLPGWDRDRSDCRLGDDGWWRCTWGDGLTGAYGQESAEGGRVGHVVRLRIHLRNTTLYGWNVGEEHAMPDYLS